MTVPCIFVIGCETLEKKEKLKLVYNTDVPYRTVPMEKLTATDQEDVGSPLGELTRSEHPQMINYTCFSFGQREEQAASNCPTEDHSTPGESQSSVMRITTRGGEHIIRIIHLYLTQNMYKNILAQSMVS